MGNEMIELSDAQAAEYGFTPASTETTAEVTNVVSAVETKPGTTPPAVEKTVESESPKTEEPQITDGGKTPYTPEEISKLLKDEVATGKILLDTSRLNDTGMAIYKSFQQGFTPKFEQAKKMREDALRIRAEIEQVKKDAENQKILQKETDELGEEEAQRRLTERQMQERLNKLEWETQQAKQQAASMQIRDDYRQIAPKYFVPQDQEWEYIVLSNIIANDILKIEGAPTNIDESTAKISDKFGFTNINNLWKIIRANPANEKDVEKFYVNKYIKEKTKGPTISSSSTANIQKPLVKDDPSKSAMTNILDHFGVKNLDEINLT